MRVLKLCVVSKGVRCCSPRLWTSSKSAKDYSSESNVTQIIVATDDTNYSATQAIYAETLAHFGEFVRTGNVSASTHASSTVERIEADAVDAASENERANKARSAPKTKKPR